MPGHNRLSSPLSLPLSPPFACTLTHHSCTLPRGRQTTLIVYFRSCTLAFAAACINAFSPSTRSRVHAATPSKYPAPFPAPFCLVQASVLAEHLLASNPDVIKILFNKFYSAISFKPTITTILSPQVNLVAPHPHLQLFRTRLEP